MLGEANGNPLRYSCLEKPMDRGAWRAAVHGVAKSQTRLNTYTLVSRQLCWRARPVSKSQSTAIWKWSLHGIP